MTATGGKFAGRRGEPQGIRSVHLTMREGRPRVSSAFWTRAVVPLAREVAASIFHFLLEAGNFVIVI